MNRIRSLLKKRVGLIALASVVMLAIMAYFMKKEDVAHTTVSIGVCAFDSSRVDFTLRSFGMWARKNNGGEINWRYIKNYSERDSCDLYMLTSVQAAKSVNKDRARLFLTAKATNDGKYPKGVIFMRKDPVFKGEPIVFLSSESAACFLSPMLALKDSMNSSGMGGADIEFLDCGSCFRKLFFGVLFGEYIAGGIDIDRFNLLMSTEIEGENNLRIVARGIRVPEIFLMASESADKRKLKSLRKIFTRKFNEMPNLLKRDFLELGIAGFSSSEAEELEMVEEMLSLYNKGNFKYRP